MRILISADIEGVSGVVHPEQTRPGSGEYERARGLLTKEVNACIRGALEGGACDIVVTDAHGTYRNIILDQLHGDASLISGKPRLFGMMSGLEECGHFDGAFLVGYHARAGSLGVLAHTINGSAFRLITLDGKAVGESYLNAALAGIHNVPIALVSGDDCLSREISFLRAEVVTTKQALGNRAAVNMPLNQVYEALHQAASTAVTRIETLQPLESEEDIWVEVHTVQAVQADLFSQMENIERLDAMSVGFKGQNIRSVLKTLNTFSALAASL